MAGAPCSGAAKIRRSAPAVLCVVTLAIAAAASLTPAPAQILSHCTAPAKPGVNWLRCFFNERDFSGVDLTGAVLKESSFNRTVLKKAVLRGVDARGAKFVSADLSEAVLAHAVLTGADFTRANLQHADLSDADLREARLFRADLRGANLKGARLDGADLFMASLDGAIWTDGTRCAEGSRGLCRSTTP